MSIKERLKLDTGDRMMAAEQKINKVLGLPLYSGYRIARGKNISADYFRADDVLRLLRDAHE
jgi:hypothetical protein